VSSSSIQKNRATQLSLPKANDPPGSHLGWKLCSLASLPEDLDHLVLGRLSPWEKVKDPFVAFLLHHYQLGVFLSWLGFHQLTG